MSMTYKRKWKYSGAIIRQRGSAFQVETNYNRIRERQSFSTLPEAKTYAELKKNELRNLGTAAFDLTQKQRQDAREAIESLNGSTSLLNAARFWMQHNRPTGAVKTMKELFSTFLLQKSKLNRRPETLRELENKLGKFTASFNERPVQSVTTSEIEDWLDRHTHTPSNRNKYKRLAHAFFQFAIRQGSIENNPAAKIESAHVDEQLANIYTVSEVSKLLMTACELYPQIIPGLCVGLFAGLRPSETFGLDWKHVDFDSCYITILPQTAKRRRTRHVAMSANLIEWLLPHRQDAGLLSPPDSVFRRCRNNVIKELKIQWIADGLRHSFGSYHLAMFQDAPKTAHEMGHLGVSLLYNHYRNLVKPNDARKYWAIKPNIRTEETALI